ncbi:MAG: BtpA/SgcQ family protein [Candidatus Methanomethylicaceae archaeon]
MSNLFELKPLIITALHLPPFDRGKPLDSFWLEEYFLKNLEVFVKGGVRAILVQDQTVCSGSAYPETIATMASLVRLGRREFPDIIFGIILEAHDGVAPLAVAAACGASFVRIKVFIGAMLKSSGILHGCGIEAASYRRLIGRGDIAILADVFDRTGVPLGSVPLEQAAQWALHLGADGLILTGSTFQESIGMLQKIRQSQSSARLILGGGVDINNVSQVFSIADGFIVSSSLKKNPCDEDDLIKWDIAKVKALVEKAYPSEG